MAVTDYNALTDDLQALLAANVVDGNGNSPDAVYIEANDIQQQLMKHRLINIRLTETDDNIRVGQSYYTTITYEIDVAGYDLSRFSTAAIIRNDLVQSIKTVLRANPRFSGENDSTRAGDTTFGDADAERGFIAAAIVTVEIDRYENA